MIRPKIIIGLIFFFIYFIQLIDGQGISKTGKKDGTAIFKRAVNIPQGNYHIKNVKTKKYLTFVQPGTLVQPNSKKKSKQTIWNTLRYKNKLYSFNHNNGNLKKCISSRWTNGRNDAAVLWQAQLKYKKNNKRGLTRRYDPILPEKQVWVLVPVAKRKNTYKIIAYSHLYDMIPTCISSQSTGGHTSRGGTVLKKCKYNTNDSSLYWTFEKA
ncbi:hypothetical protein BJ944DRAFT_271804 [Cunninghamella echinulata]|nr:hypothetical protein BJ944DRAFT_271804 [Cunninghamella echinulata]